MLVKEVTREPPDCISREALMDHEIFFSSWDSGQEVFFFGPPAGPIIEELPDAICDKEEEVPALSDAPASFFAIAKSSMPFMLPSSKARPKPQPKPKAARRTRIRGKQPPKRG